MTGDILFNQASIMVNVKNKPSMNIFGPDTVTVNQLVEFSGECNSEDLKPLEFYWQFFENDIIRGKKVSYSYHSPGIYPLKLSVRGTGKGHESKDYCAYKNILVIDKKGKR